MDGDKVPQTPEDWDIVFQGFSLDYLDQFTRVTGAAAYGNFIARQMKGQAVASQVANADAALTRAINRLRAEEKNVVR